jgi:Fe-S oxidoreductase
MAGRIRQMKQELNSYEYIPVMDTPHADVIFFAGCMTQLQPSVKRSMVEIMKAAKVKFLFIDENKSICCGRPLLLAGKKAQAMELMTKNKLLFENSDAKTLVTSCPICYKMFKEEYNLNMRVLHHSEFLNEIIEKKHIEVNYQNISAVYHDPCELGRGSGIFEQPRDLLKHVLQLLPSGNEKEESLCCGGSLANLNIDAESRNLVTASAFSELTINGPDILITGCPACKKTFSSRSNIQVMDISEIVFKSIIRKDFYLEPNMFKKKVLINDLQLTET